MQRRKSAFLLIFTMLFAGVLYVSDIYWAKPTTAVFRMPLEGKTFVLDAGHGGVDGGAKGPDGTMEKTVTLPIVLYLRDLMVQAGAHVVLTRDIDKDLAPSDLQGLSKRKTADLKSRLQIIRNAKPDLFISVHTNADPSPQWSGAQTFYPKDDESSKEIANLVQRSFQNHLIPTNRQVKQIEGIYLMTHADVPAVLAEVGFISNPTESSKLKTKAYQQTIAACIYTAVVQYYSEKLGRL
ncbi:N-acetylmuramoyl-L-alanine amidase [Fodinisporobacter ferrooxydans]|uniref:N-acetylmuramoyl-L-alanine amidase n=1 Tax=Fodinisporobacter ferrooxydans TaxID=2901836 RepID=A0ABY4CNA5_9BACL|nr:N-acetylmuramoyl-L-alanine amidase [Alicyclobacillaceae bacterium MYW30-H2]